MINKRPRQTAHKGTTKGTRKKPPTKPQKPSADNGRAIIVDPTPPSTLRGILPTPPEVEELVARELEGHPVTDREKQRLTDCFKLQYYFGGRWIAYRQTDQGKEVLAVGMEEIARLMRKRLAAAEREAIVLGYCDPW